VRIRETPTTNKTIAYTTMDCHQRAGGQVLPCPPGGGTARR
jgi:hypothetical protein